MVTNGLTMPAQTYQSIKGKVIANQSLWWTPGYKSNFVTNDLFLNLVDLMQSDFSRIQNEQAQIKGQLAQVNTKLSLYA